VDVKKNQFVKCYKCLVSLLEQEVSALHVRKKNTGMAWRYAINLH